MSTDVSTFFEDQIKPFRGLSGRPLDRALSRLLRAFQGHIWSWAKTACRSHGDSDYSHADDVFNVISLELSIVLREELTNPAEPPIRNYWSFFRLISQRESFAYFHSSEVTGMSNAGGAARRASKINKTRKELTIANGAPPTDQMIVDEVNEQATKTRKDPKKQGALVTLDDMKMTSFHSLDGLTEEFGDSIWADEIDEDAPLTRAEAPSLIDLIVAACKVESAEMGQVAQAWIGEAMSEPPVVRTEREVATLLALKLGVVTELFESAKAVAVAICFAEYGITSPFV